MTTAAPALASEPTLEARAILRRRDAPNLTRIVVGGETASEWLRLTVDARAREVFAWSRQLVG